jgi:predicted transcriptional regulator
MKSESSVISLRVPNELYAKLEHIVKVTKRNKADLLLHWVEQAVELEEWQVQEVEAGMNEANAGMFAAQENVDKVLNKWL